MSTPGSDGRQTHTGRSRKKFLQRLYRSTEAEDFSQLKQAIQETTQETPHTRHDILMKAVEIIRQLDIEYRCLLAEQAALTSNAVSSTQHTAFDPAVSHVPAESWLVNHGHQTMPIHPHMPSSSSIVHNMYTGQNMDDATTQNMDDATYDYLYFTYQRE
ncbi:uncharacterized protein EDB91DRAFT_1248012 [Suillus paluster]|uniref:uncharacterized protein n=1 Tax=Suillus paluster TaxID=48578 RepID=UPI001B876066|nr:uncharacterized protein EDB91DRAFT_1248012 [Suillus paluster]KAG1741459.1 hypothetical protein EDB91DRAFT_1248012 [Suillus paluster]